MKSKKLFTLLLTLCLALLCLPMAANAAVADSGTCGDGLTWSLDDDLNLTITGTGSIPDYASADETPWAQYRSFIVSVTISDGVTGIGDYAFNNCTHLTEITLPGSVTSIGDYAFNGCTTLTEIDLPYGVAAIGSYAFNGCTAAKSITIPETVTTLGSFAFSGCSSLEEIHYNAIAVENDPRSFGRCGLESSGIHVIIGNKVTAIPANLFTESTIGNVNITKVTFQEGSVCESIGSNAFYSCDGLTSIDLPDSITTIGNYAFRNCTALTSVKLPKNLTTIGEGAFYDCDALTAIQIPESVTSLGVGAFRNCDALESANIPKNLAVIETDLFSGCGRLASIELPENLTSIGEDAFYNCDSLTSITIPENVTAIADSAFYGCDYLVSIYYNANVSDSDFGDDVFGAVGAKASGITLTVGANVTSLPAWFFYNRNYSDPNLKEVVFAEGSVCQSIGNSAFYMCWYLSKVTLPDSLTTIGDSAFGRCTGLTTINIPKNVTTIGSGAFSHCESLDDLYFDAAAMEDLTEDSDLFYRAGTNGSGITVTVGPNAAKIPAYLFYVKNEAYRPNVTAVVFEAGSTCRIIGIESFGGCAGLTEITLPESISRINMFAFDACTALSKVTFTGSAPAITNYAFSGVTANCCYPHGNDTWTADVMKDYGGTLTWSASCTDQDGDGDHKCDFCTTENVTACFNRDGDHNCDECGKVLSDCADTNNDHNCDVCGKALSSCADADGSGKCDTCGTDMETPAADHEVVRVFGDGRWQTAIKVADEMKEQLCVDKFNAIIIASGNDFADALAGSYLSTVKSAPILLSWGNGGRYAYLDVENLAYIRANLAKDGTVYILGGDKAVPELYETGLIGCNVKRLGGANRFETNLLILEEAGVSKGDEILVCTSTNFADSLSASATGKPILLVFNQSGKLYGAQPEYLATLDSCTFTVVGGESAVCAALAEEIAAYGEVTRLAGANRFETSVMVAKTYFKAPETAVLAYAWNYPDGLCGGALAYSMDAPLILTMTKYEAEAVAYATGNTITSGIVLGGDTLISDEAVRSIFAMDPNAEIVVK